MKKAWAISVTSSGLIKCRRAALILYEVCASSDARSGPLTSRRPIRVRRRPVEMKGVVSTCHRPASDCQSCIRIEIVKWNCRRVLQDGRREIVWDYSTGSWRYRTWIAGKHRRVRNTGALSTERLMVIRQNRQTNKLGTIWATRIASTNSAVRNRPPDGSIGLHQ